jgi:hypothetical protein
MRPIVLLALPALLACSDVEGPTPLPLELSIGQSHTQVPAFAAAAAYDTLDLTGYIGTGGPCVDFRAAAQVVGSSLTVTLIATPQPGACITMLATFMYRIRVGPVPPGRYDITLSHRYEDASLRDTTVFTTSVQLPG